MVEGAREKEIRPVGRIKFVGFDMDGTLIDTMPGFADVFGREVGPKFGISEVEAGDFFIAHLGIPAHEQIRILHRKLFNSDFPLEEAMRIGDSVEDGLIGIEAQPFPEITGMLKNLVDRGYLLFVSSSHRTERASKKLKSVGLGGFFEYVIGKDPEYPEFTKGEPHFRAAADHFGIPYDDFKKQLVYVGDLKKDIETAVKAGVIAIGRIGTVNETDLLHEGAALSLPDLKGLPDLLPDM